MSTEREEIISFLLGRLDMKNTTITELTARVAGLEAKIAKIETKPETGSPAA